MCHEDSNTTMYLNLGVLALNNTGKDIRSSTLCRVHLFQDNTGTFNISIDTPELPSRWCCMHFLCPQGLTVLHIPTEDVTKGTIKPVRVGTVVNILAVTPSYSNM